MQDKDDFAKLTATLAERRRYFTLDWFRDLLGARLSLGDTFWIGTYGTALIYVPGTVLLVLLARIALPPAAAAALTGLAFALLAVQVSDSVAGALWAKLIINCAYNALSAITQLPYGRIVQGEGVAAMMEDIVAECLAVAQADGIAVPGDIRAAVAGIAVSMATQVSSTAHDVARGKPSEIDHINGYVVRRGAALGIATPVNRALHALVKLL